jgi:hypothetical protein
MNLNRLAPDDSQVGQFDVRGPSGSTIHNRHLIPILANL